jgi:electron transport complex protein RnfD
MVSLAKTLELRTSPHVTSGASVDTIMRHVVWALVPTALFGVYAFGLTAAVTLAAATASCLLAEWLLCRWSGQPSTLSDWSIAVTGVLYGLTLPPGLPVWMTALGAFIAVALGKHLFGGLGYNPFNPALVGRAVLQAAFPVGMTTWHPAFGAGRFTQVASSLFTFPFAIPEYTDALTGATPLAAWKFEHQLTTASDLALGLTSGSTGETSAALILLGGVVPGGPQDDELAHPGGHLRHRGASSPPRSTWPPPRPTPAPPSCSSPAA